MLSLITASRLNNITIVRKLLKNITKNSLELEQAIYTAAIYENMEVFQYLYKRIPNYPNKSITNNCKIY